MTETVCIRRETTRNGLKDREENGTGCPARGYPQFSELVDGWLDVFCDGCPSIRFVGECDIDPGCARCATGAEAEPWNGRCVRHERYREIDESQRTIDRAVLGEAV